MVSFRQDKNLRGKNYYTVKITSSEAQLQFLPHDTSLLFYPGIVIVAPSPTGFNCVILWKDYLRDLIDHRQRMVIHAGEVVADSSELRLLQGVWGLVRHVLITHKVHVPEPSGNLVATPWTNFPATKRDTNRIARWLEEELF